MPQFSYIARDANGQDIAGLLSANNHRDAIAQLASRALFPIKIENAKRKSGGVRLQLPWKNRIRTEVLAANLTQLADLLQNGVALLASLKILAKQGGHPVMREVMQDVHDQVAEGVPLEDAMARHPRVFSELTLSMVRAGTEGAFLEDALRRVADFLEHQEALRGRVMSAMFYPAILAVFGIFITVVLVVFFVPKFAGLFERLESSGAGLPAATVLLLWVSDLIRDYWLAILLALCGGTWALRTYLKTDGARDLIDRWKLRLPIVGRILHNTALARFCRVLGTLLQNGVPILKALRISSDSTGNRQLSQAIVESVENVSAGETLSRPLAACGLIPADVMAMIGVAEEANTLERVLINVASRMDEKIERQLDMMVRLVEPIMLVLIGGMVFFILVALLLPIFDMATTVG